MSEETKDKSLIWEDCAQCAYKHLTAAYAALTSVIGNREEMNICKPDDVVFYARAHILKREADAGYTGNLDLAIGCLAMAEQTAVERDIAEVYRALRRYWSGETSLVGCFCPSVDLASYAAGHIIEAIRELPSLDDRGGLLCVYGGSFVTDDVSSVLSALREAIKWLKDTYEIGAMKHGN